MYLYRKIGQNDSYNIKDDDQVLVSSEVTANIADVNSPHAFQNFKISAFLWAKVDPLPNKKNDLKFSIDINDCRAGPMISEKWPLLQKLGIGYFLESVIIWITPISNTSISDKSLYTLKSIPNPSNFNKEISMSEVREYNHGIGASISRDLGVNFNYGKRNEQSSTSTTTEWKLTVDGCGVTGLGWRHQYAANSPFKDLDSRRNFAPGRHSCHWNISEAMSGFRIIITQLLCCKITNGWRKYNPITKSKLKKLCPKMAHTFEISFNSLENFDENFANLKNSEEYHEDLLNVTLAKNSLPQIENSKNYNIGNIKIQRSFKKFEDK
ncbi:hypothetical protein Glove_658g30 [Diversispora epigaea]|uniref:Uncharacterized protein n=1 Tax=Diversispora epigaea TaxID=1348612 RepID=A0A397G3Y4_9GLOM|nr:hypothetical protein Glove_658g30 [Diversispora epigaea]